MNWCCTRCGHRQDAEAECGKCGHFRVHDLRSRRTRELIYDVEAEHRDARSSLAKKLAALVAMVVLLGILGTVIALDIDVWHVSTRREPFVVVAAGLVGVAIWSILERVLYRPRFPFVAGLPPTDRP